jgi:hypothetical protein
LQQLESEARSRQITKSQLIRESLEKNLLPPDSSVKASCYDLAKDLAGSLKGLPKDLSTNPKYMKGFGQ